MSDEMGEKFKQIAEMLGGQNSNTNIPENVKGLLNMFMSNSDTKDESPSDDSDTNKDTPEASSKVNSDEAEDMKRKMKKAMSMLNKPQDPKIDLLNAIKPFLNQNRQRKLQTCLKLLKIGDLTKLFED